jgi:glycosyltransferase involved in cell wall biosynthesis
MVRLLIVTFDPPENIGGIEGRAVQYAKILPKNGNYVRVFSLGKDGNRSEENFHGAKLNRLPSSLRRIGSSFRFTANQISKDSIDSVFLLSGALSLYGILLLVYCRLINLRSVILFYGKDILVAKSNPALRAALIIACILAKRIAVNSRFTGSLIPMFVRQHKIGVLYPGVDPTILTKFEQRSDRIEELRKGTTILFVGRLVKRKGVDDLLQAFNSLSKEIPDARLEIVGEGPERKYLEDLSNKMNLNDKVRFLGELRENYLYERYYNCDVFVMPSKTLKEDVEGFGTVFLEAGLFGKPCVGTLSGGIPEAIENRVTGLLVPESDILALEEAMKRLLLDTELRFRLGRNSKDHVLRRFTWLESSKGLMKLLSDKRVQPTA